MLCYRGFRSQAELFSTMRLTRFYSQHKNSNLALHPVLYGDEASPPVRFVMMTAAALGTKLDFQRIDLFLGVNKSQFYKKINPLQKVPALCVNKQVILDSHAIALYLCQTSDKRELLYPEHIVEKTKVDQMLFFNATELFPVDSEILSAFFAGTWPVKKEKVDRWFFLIDHLEKVLTENKWSAGEKMTLSDLCCASTITSLQLLLPLLDHHVKVNQWMELLNTLPFFDINKQGIERLKGFVDKMKDFYATNKVC